MIRKIIDDVNELLDYSYKDVLLGVVHPHDNKGKTIPADSKGTLYAQAIPDSTRTSIVYWEDHGSVTVRQHVRFRIIEHTMHLVVWLNFNKITQGYDECVSEILDTLPQRMGTVLFSVTGQLPKSTEIFTRYDYQERKQYITYPYDAIAFKVMVKYIETKC